jgi:hypothetical protein
VSAGDDSENKYADGGYYEGYPKRYKLIAIKVIPFILSQKTCPKN